MVFSIVFSNCHLPSAILLCKKTGQSHDRPANTNTIQTHGMCNMCYANIMLCFRLFKSFSKNLLHPL